jgi:hypothetical protein
MARLATHVHVQDDQGQNHVFGPGDDVPDWAAKAITNPNAWADKPAKQEPNGGQAPAGEPPRGGAGSGRDAWAAYAAEKGVTVPDDASRDDIIAALVEAGVVEAE